MLFVLVEDQNFALFNYVNELNNEIELVQEQIQEVRLSYVNSVHLPVECVYTGTAGD